VWARSKPGQGTTFVVRLHRLEAERPALAANGLGQKMLAGAAAMGASHG
jgi:hypothetical protein